LPNTHEEHIVMAIVCHCNAVRERTIEKAIRRGATTVADIQAECGAAARCGGCEPVVRSMLAHSRRGEFVFETAVAIAV
jgi:bacterioferritin-associated ferredoxin